jgi:hypothetical protein
MEVSMLHLKKVTLCLILVAAISLPLTISGCEVVTGSGELMTLVMDYEDFERIEAGYAFDIEITRADTYKVHIIIDEALVEYLNVKKSGGTVYIGLKSGYNYMKQIRRAEITLPRLSRLELSGASEGTISGFSTSGDMSFELSGASSLNIEDLKTGVVNLDMSGASDITGKVETSEGKFGLSGASNLKLSGSAAEIKIEASGASEVTLTDFPVVNADVELSGGSDAEIDVSGRLSIDLSGGSKLSYAGDPKLGSIDVSGSSSIVQK